ncbi:uncharacterized protein LOC135834188 [Planococcus citri]|uniref:uncharacterized protein LOC135834188 n=1 Tax=Planococcus citri TaxID=170843 RepID=UPI0031F895B6
MVFGLDRLEPFYWKNPTDYRTLYDMQIVGYVDLAFCVITVISNAVIVAIFTKKHLTSSANSIFTHMAVTESIAEISYLPRVWHEFFRGTYCAIPQHRTYHWELSSFCSYVIYIMFRNTGVWLAGMLAVWRYIAVLHPLCERDWCNMQITRKFIIAGYVFGLLTVVSLPIGLEVQPTVRYLDAEGCMRWDGTNGTNTTIYELQIPLENNPILYSAVAAYLSVMKTLPSVVMAIISCR